MKQGAFKGAAVLGAADHEMSSFPGAGSLERLERTIVPRAELKASTLPMQIE